MKLQLKFGPNADGLSRKAVAEEAQRLGASAVRQLFPDADKPELRDLFIVDVADDADVNRLSDQLVKEDAVESVEPELERWLTA